MNGVWWIAIPLLSLGVTAVHAASATCSEEFTVSPAAIGAGTIIISQVVSSETAKSRRVRLHGVYACTLGTGLSPRPDRREEVAT
jgi:hypothetical protein